MDIIISSHHTGIPLMIIVEAFGRIPWFLMLKLMVDSAKTEGWYEAKVYSIYLAFLWWITPQRLFYYFLIRIAKRCIVPIIKIIIVIIIKHMIVGKFKSLDGVEKQSDWNKFRYWIMFKLLPGGKLLGVSKLVGSHYEIISIIFRLLGAKVFRGDAGCDDD
jgi:hypothetical protein